MLSKGKTRTELLNEIKRLRTRVAKLEREAAPRKRQTLQRRNQAVDAQQLREVLVEQIIVTRPNLIYVFDLAKQSNIYVNRQLAELLGYTKKEIRKRGTSITDQVMHPKDISLIAENRQRVARAKDGEIIRTEFRMKHANGEWRWIGTGESVFTRTSQGAVAQVLGIAQDITERKQISERLRESEERYRGLFEQAVDGIFIFNAQGHLIDVNSSGCQMLGYSRNELRRRSLFDLIVPDQRTHTQLDWGEILAGTGEVYECQMRRKSGESLSIEISLKAQPDGQWQGIVRDISQRKEIEAKLRTSEELYRTLVNISPECIMITDLQDRIIMMSLRGVEMFGYHHAEEGLGRSLLELILPEQHVLVRQTIERILAGRSAGAEQFTAIRQDGSRFDFETTGEVIRDAQGQAQAMFFISRDITERKKNEAAMQQANEKLRAQLDEIQALDALLREQATRDGLTGLFNRRYMQETLEREISFAFRDHWPVGMVMLDIDQFKDFNDRYGHAAGDLILQAMGALLVSHTRQMDVACRFGGEEFIVIMPTAPLHVATRRAEELRQAFAELRIEYQGSVLQTTVSVGVAVFPDHGNNSNALLTAVDQALYAAKAAGRNVVREAGPVAIS